MACKIFRSCQPLHYWLIIRELKAEQKIPEVKWKGVAAVNLIQNIENLIFFKNWLI